jgi:hypothetical protein
VNPLNQEWSYALVASKVKSDAACQACFILVRGNRIRRGLTRLSWFGEIDLNQ